MSTLGERIKSARGSMSQDAFAKLLDISKGSLGFYERDENLPKVDVALKICSTTGVSLEWLLYGRGEVQAGVAGATPVPMQETVSSCSHCLELYKKLDKANERLYEAMKENGDLKEKIGHLEKDLEILKNTLPEEEGDDDSPIANVS